MIKIFLIGATGFIGQQALKALCGRPDVEVTALARNEKSAEEITRQGAKAILGDLGEDGAWQQAVAEAHVVIHAAQPATFGKRITAKIARDYEQHRLAMDQRLFNSLSKAKSQRLLYVSGNSFYGETGSSALLDETMTPRPTGFGPYIQTAVANAEKLASTNRQIVVVFPGAVYGKGSWLKEYFLDPIAAGKPVMQISGPPRWASPISVVDCGRAIAHLALLPKMQFASSCERFFLVDNKPSTYKDITILCGRVLGKPLKIRKIPGFMLGLFAGPVVRSYMETNSRYSNHKLLGTGFEFLYPTIDTGIPAIIT